MRNRAYSILTVKAVDEDQRIIRGIATTPEPDRMGDIVDPLGAEFRNPMPLLWQHDSLSPVGNVNFGKATKDGIPFTARLPKIEQPVGLKARIDEAWESVKAGLVAAVSIGFRPIEYSIIEETGGYRFNKTEILELSLVTIPANREATITEIKSLDAHIRAASGEQKDRAEEGNPPARVGAQETAVKTAATSQQKPIVKLTPKEGKKMDIQEQIRQFQNERGSKAAQMEALMKKAAEAGASLAEDEAEKFDTLEQEVATIDKHIERLEKLQVSKMKAAKAVDTAAGRSIEVAVETRSGTGPTIYIPKNQPEKFKGQNYTRVVIAKTLAQIFHVAPSAVAAQRWAKTNPELVEYIKANEVAGLGTGGGEAGTELVGPAYMGDFIEYLYSNTVYDKLPLTQVPANIPIKGQDGAATGYWIGESKAAKVSKPDFSTVTLSPLKVSALATISKELLRDSSWSSEQLVRDALVAASAQRVDATFLSTDAASAGVSPAGLLNGLAAISSAGNDGDAVRLDIAALYAPFISANNASGLTFVCNTSLAKKLQLMRNALGQKEFPGVTQNGGELEGDTLVTGDNIGASHLILLKPKDIYRIADTGLEIEMSREATIEQSAAPPGAGDTPTAQSQAMVNMFQSDMVAIKVTRSINFAKRRTSAVAYVDDAAYGSVES